MQDLSAGGDDGPTQDDETILTEIKKKAEQSNYTAVITIAPEERSVNYIICNHDCAYDFIFLAFVRHNLCDYLARYRKQNGLFPYFPFKTAIQTHLVL